MFQNTSTMKKENGSQINDYLRNDVMALSSTEIILRIYDFAILNLKKNQPQKALRAITELIVSLNFDYKDFSLNLLKIYQYCREQIIAGNSPEALGLLEELRATWAKAFNLI